ncbi:MAG: dephospho-CoA kinase [Lachnospiraceae bacterium]
MKVIGITGGVGAGKSEVLKYIQEQYNCRVILADDVGNEVKLPGNACYEALIEVLGRDILTKEGFIDKQKMADKIFCNQSLLQKVNEIIHPAVIDYILKERDKEKKVGKLDFFFIEAALLIECGFLSYVDEMWYIYADEQVRSKRLTESRQYSKEKILAVMKGQLSEQQFRENCDRVIDNSKDFETTKQQIDKILGDELWKMQKNTRDN